jgi:hypothetical protein
MFSLNTFESRVTDGLPECLRFHLGFALYPVDYLRAKDDFEILSTPVGASTIGQLFQGFFIGQEFTGSSGPAARNSCCNQNYLAGALVSETGGNCIVFENVTLPGI